MTIQNYLMINQSINVVENVCAWDGNPETWTPPANYLMLIQANTMALVWFYDHALNDWVLEQKIGEGQIGFLWNGAECVTNEPKPENPVPPPTVVGSQNL